MANYYTIVTPERGLPCTEAEANEIESILEAVAEGDNEWSYHGFRFMWEAGEGFLEAEENGDWDALPDEVLKRISALITRAGWPYLEFGAAFTASRMIPDSHGGTAFRIMANGTIVTRLETWA